jgi:membrane protein
VHNLAVFKDPRALFELLKETYRDWSEDKASRLAAALAYYTAFSVAPLLLITIAVAGLVFGREAAQGRIVDQLQGLMGPAAGAIETSLANSQDKNAGALSTIIGLATLVWSASSLFGQLQEALNTIWEVTPDPNAGILATLKRRFLSMTMVLGVGFVLLVSLVITASVSAVGAFFGDLLPGGAFLWQIANFVLSFAVVTLLFAAIYKVLPDVTVAWSDVWIGSAVTALLFTVGKLLIGLYLGHASIGSTFGAAGSLLVFLVWVYYSAQILFFGAEFTQVYARRYGSRIVPAEGAVALTEESRAQQGIPARETVEQAATLQSGHELASAAQSRPDGVRPQHPGTPAQANGMVASRCGNETNVSANGHAVNSTDGSNKKPRPRGSGGTKGAPDAVKKLMWAGVVSGSVAVGAMAARRASVEIWRAIFREDPPTKEV